MKQVGIVGWRGMVGSVLLQRMIEEMISTIFQRIFLVPPVRVPLVRLLKVKATN